MSSAALRTDQARQALRAAAARQDADQHFGQADLGARHGDAVVAGERVLEPAAERVAVDRRDDRLLALRPARRPDARRCRAAGALAELADVRAGDEAAARADQHHRLDVRIRCCPSRRASRMPSRTPGLSAFTGGLSTVMTPMPSSTSNRTSCPLTTFPRCCRRHFGALGLGGDLGRARLVPQGRNWRMALSKAECLGSANATR